MGNCKMNSRINEPDDVNSLPQTSCGLITSLIYQRYLWYFCDAISCYSSDTYTKHRLIQKNMPEAIFGGHISPVGVGLLMTSVFLKTGQRPV